MTETTMGEAARAGAEAGRGEVNIRGASLRAIYIIWYRDILRYWRDRWRLGASLAQPLLFLIIFGTGLSSSLRGTGSFGGPGVSLSYQQFMFPGIISMAVLFTSIFGAMSIVWDREFGFLKEVLVAPINRSAVAIGKTLGSATQAMIQGLILLILAPFVGVTLTPLLILAIVPLTFVLAFALSAFGVAIASGMKSLQAFQVVINFMMMPMFFLSGALFPLTRLPGWMTILTHIDPAAYGVDPLRRTVLTASNVPSTVVHGLSLSIAGNVLPILLEEGILLGFGAVLLSAAIWNFQIHD